jgi:hypothetical protein
MSFSVIEVLPHSWDSSSISLHPRPSKSKQLIETQWDAPCSLQKVKRQLSDARSVKRSGSRINNLYILPAYRPATRLRENPESAQEPV